MKEDSNGYTLNMETCMIAGEYGHEYTNQFKSSFVEFQVDSTEKSVTVMYRTS